MMSTRSFNHRRFVIIIFFFILLLAVAESAASFRGPSVLVTVHVYNYLMNGESMRIHCKSQDDDVGVRDVRGEKDEYKFSFRPKNDRTTRYRCSVEWENVTRWFNAYVDRRDAGSCRGYCWWHLRADGPCLHDWNTKREICYAWDKTY